MPMEGEELVVAPSQPFAEIFNKKPEPPPDNLKIRNRFWSHRYRCQVLVFEKDRKIVGRVVPGIHNIDQQLRTLGCSAAWGLEQESKAVRLLGTLVRHHQFKKYLLTGAFLERSEKSGVYYFFRKLRPTVAFTEKGEELKILCSLCMHPIAYYQDSWAGAMTPTDDVIAHLMLMRADEHLYWKRCNQHPASRPEAGL